MNWLFQYTPLKFFIQDFWRDEAFSYLLAKNGIFKIFVLTAKDFNPPLYYVVLHFWMMIFGHSEIAIRSLSLVFFVLMIYMSVDFMIDVFKFSIKKSLLYVLLIACNPLLLYYAFEGRMYSMFAFFIVLSFYGFFTKKKKLYYLGTVLGLYTHYFMILVVIVQAIIVYLENKKTARISALTKNFLVIFLLFLPWILFTFTQKSLAGGSSFWIKPLSFEEYFIFPSLLYTGYEKDLSYLDWTYTAFILPVISLIIYFLIGTSYLFIKKNVHKKNLLVKELLLWSFLPAIIIIVVSFIRPLFLPRYLIVANLGILFFMIYSINLLPKKLKIISLIILATTTIIYNNVQIQYREKSPVANRFREIKSIAKPDDYIYVTNHFDFFTAEYYFDENKVRIYNKSSGEIPSYDGKILVPDDKVTSLLPPYPQRAFIFNDDGTYQIQSAF
jgi:uncharacterized membrane protein